MVHMVILFHSYSEILSDQTPKTGQAICPFIFFHICIRVHLLIILFAFKYHVSLLGDPHHTGTALFVNADYAIKHLYSIKKRN